MGNAIGAVEGFLEDQEVRHHGAEWLREVSDEVPSIPDEELITVHWKPLDDWVTTFEPVREESKREKEIKSTITSKATEIMLDRIDKRIVARVLRLILDVSSQLLTLAESKLPTKDAVARILNNMNGIILSFRFQNDDKKLKFEYFRRRATNDLTKTLWEHLPSEDTAAALLQLQQHVEQILLRLNNQVRPMVESTLDEILVQVNQQVDERVEERLGDSRVTQTFEERLMQFDEAANKVSSTIESIEVMAETVAVAADDVVVNVASTTGTTSLIEEQRVALEQTTVSEAAVLKEQVKIQQDATIVAVHEKAAEIEHDVIATKDAVLLKKTQVLSNFAELVKSLVTTKMDQITSKMMEFMNRLFLAFYQLHIVARVAETKSTNTLQELQDKMYVHVQELAKHIKEQVEAEVKMVTDTIGAMMLKPAQDEDEEAEKLETDEKDS